MLSKRSHLSQQGGAGGGFGNSAGSSSSNSSIAGLTGGKGGGIKGNVTFQEGYTYILIRGCAGSGVESQNNSGGSRTTNEARGAVV